MPLSSFLAYPTGVERMLFGLFNAVVRPLIKSGWAGADVLPAGFIVVDAPGRTSGLERSVPLAALSVGGHVLVATVRGRRSQWIRNLGAAREVCYWWGGDPKRAKTIVFAAPGRREPSVEDLPAVIQAIVRALSPYRSWGLAFAVLVPIR